LERAIIHGTATAPMWLPMLEIASRWHSSPYKVFGGSKLLWYAREMAVRKCEIKKNEKIERERKIAAMRNGK